MTSPSPLNPDMPSGDAFSLMGQCQPTLLVVDDEEGPRQSLRIIFNDHFNVLLASDGPSAIELAKQNHIDVAVLDIRMGGMSGLEVLERLKFVDPSIEAVMMTAFETNDTMRQALRLRACDYITKPFDISTMRAAVASALERRTLASEVRHNAEQVHRLQSELQEQQLEGEIVRSRGEIYAIIIHDITGPLIIISGLIQIMNERIGDKTEISGDDLHVVKDRLKRVTRQVTNCIEISRRYLSFLRHGPDDSAGVWVNQILGDVGELLRIHPSKKNHQLLIHPLPEDVTVDINGIDLIQILLNLTINALQCTSNYHRVELLGQLLPEALDLSHFHDGPEDCFINRAGFKNQGPLLSVSVQDNGPGIPPEVMPRIFEPYFSTQPTSKGTGLGLCIVQRLLKEANGAIHAHSKVGQGTVFTVYLPARIASAEPSLELET